MEIVFYYKDWEPKAINGTQHAIATLSNELKRRYDYNCRMVNDAICCFDKNIIFRSDIAVFLSSVGHVMYQHADVPKMLWNHCWDYVEGTEKILDTFDIVMALSPKHAKHLGTEFWCYNGFDPKVFKLWPDARPRRKKVIYCGGPAWWKGERSVNNVGVLEKLNSMGYEFESIWNKEPYYLALEMNEAEFVVIPSEIESFCLVSIQAQACGCIPIARDVGGISETIPFELADMLLYDKRVPLFEKDFTPEYINYAREVCFENAKRFEISKVAEMFNDFVKNL